MRFISPKNHRALSFLTASACFSWNLFLGLAQANEATPSKHSEAKHSQGEHSKTESKPVVPKTDCSSLPNKTKNELWERVDCFYLQDKTEDTLATLKTLSRQERRELDAYFTTSWILWEQGQKIGGSTERKKTLEALEELERARLKNPMHWEVYTELGDFYYLRLKPPAFEKAYSAYAKARELYDGDETQEIPSASLGRKAAIENRLARTAEQLGRKGEAIESSCRALFFDPDDESPKVRIEKLNGSCVKKDVKNPLKKI